MSWHSFPGILSYRGTFFELEKQRISFSLPFLSSCGFYPMWRFLEKNLITL